MDESMWQTLSAFDLLHSSHLWIPTKWLWGKNSTAMQTWIVWRFWFKINIRRNLMHFRKSHVRANKLDVQETDFSFTQIHGSWTNSLDTGLRMDGIPALDLWNWWKKCSILPKTNSVKPKFHLYWETCCVTPHQTSARDPKPKFQPSTTVMMCVMLTVCLRTEIFSNLCYAVHFWRYRSRD